MEQDHKNAKRKIIIIISGVVVVAIIVAILAAVLASGYIQKKNKEKNRKILYDIWREYVDGEYQNVLSLAEIAPEPYGSYYKKLMSYRAELDSWHGTERELYEWLLAFMEEMDIEAIPDNSYSASEFLFRGINFVDNKEKLEKEREWIENEFGWYPEFYQIRVEFYQQYFMLWIENWKLYGAYPDDGTVSIPVSDLILLDSQMNTLFVTSMEALYDLQERYNIVEDGTHYVIAKEQQMMLEYKRDYDEHGAVSSGRDLDGKESAYLNFSSDAAENNYDVHKKLLAIQLWGFDIDTSNPDNGVMTVNEYACYEGPIRDILPIVDEIFPNSTLSLTDLKAPIYEVVHDFIDDYIEN